MSPEVGAQAAAGVGAAVPGGAAVPVAPLPPVRLEGTDIQGVVASFASVTPTQQAQAYATLGGRLGEVAETEHAAIEGSLPTVHADLPGEIAPPQPLSPDAFASTPAPVDIPIPTLASPAPVTAPEPGTAEAARAAGAPPSSVPPQQRSDDIHQALRETEEAAKVEGSPGPPPSLAQQAGADSAQLQTQADSAATQARDAQQQAAEAIRQGPGPEQIQPQALHAEGSAGSVAPLTVAPPAPVPGTQEYLAMNLTPDVRASFDQGVESERTGQMEQAQTQLQQAAATRDSARDAAVSQANEDAAAAKDTTVQDRNAAVETHRARIRTERDNTLARQEQEVSDAQGRMDSERTDQKGRIDTRVAADQRQIDDQYKKTDDDVKQKADEGQRKADEKRREAERKSEDESWFDRAVDWIADALEAFADAITAIFDAIKDAITTLIDAVVSLANRLIDAVVGFINDVIAALGAVLKAIVQDLLGTIFPELAAKLCRYIDEAVAKAQQAVTAIGNTLKAGIAAVASVLKAAVNAVIGVFEAAVQIGAALLTAAITGDFSALARKVLEAALAIAGISPEQFYAFIGRAEETFRIIIDDPGAFVGHLIDAFVGGVRRFSDHFFEHLQAAIISWLTGALGGAGLTLPEHFDLMGVLSLAQQILGLTWERIRQEVTRIIGERAMQVIEFVWSYIETLIQGGWPALFERIQQDLSSLADMVLNAIKDYLLERIVVAAITRLATLFNPIGALVQLLMAAWNLYTFLRDQLNRIRQVLAAIVGMIDNIARGIFGPAEEGVEGVLAGLLPLAIDLLARFLGLGGIGDKVREIFHTIQEAIWGAIRSLIGRVRGLFRGGAVQPEQAVAAGPDTQVMQGVNDEQFAVGTHQHRLHASSRDGRVAILMASDELLEVPARVLILHQLYIGTTGEKLHPGTPLANQLEGKLTAIVDLYNTVTHNASLAPTPVARAQITTHGMDQIRLLFAELGRSPFNIETEQHNEPLRHDPGLLGTDGFGRATGAVATVSSASEGQGGPASVDPPGFYILAGVPGMPRYERGHLVAGSTARSLGGPGNTIANLVPMSRQTNDPTMKNGPEKFARDRIYDDTVSPRYMLRYAIQPNYADDSALRSLLTSLGIPPAKATDLYHAAQSNVNLDDAPLASILGPATPPLTPANYIGIRKMLAYCFMPRTFHVTITPLQGPVTAVGSFPSISDHIGAALP